MKRGSFLITFRRMGAKDDCLIELPSKWKLLLWMATTGMWCKAVLIVFLEEGGGRWNNVTHWMPLPSPPEEVAQ